MRNQLAQKYLSGSGIEIGGLHNPLLVPLGVRVQYVDRMSLEELERTSDVRPAKNQIIVDDAETLATQPPHCHDFLIANHVLEHCHDPIGTLKNWHRVLKTDGVLYIALPVMTHTFDKEREVTSLYHLILDHEEGPQVRDRQHYREWFSLIDKMKGEELDRHVEFCFNDKTNIHFHCWRKSEMEQLFFHMHQLLWVVEMADNGAEIIWILRRK